MKKSKVRTLLRSIPYLLICIAIMGIHQRSDALVIESDQQLKYADTLFANQQYLRAAEEYQRFTFFFPSHPKVRQAHLKSGEAFLMAKDPSTAITIFKSIASADPPDTHAIEAFFRLSECYLALNKPTHAVVQLNNVISLSDATATKDRAYYKIGWIHIDFFDWEGAKTAFAKITPDGQQRYRLATLNQALSESVTSKIPAKSPTLAGTLSVLPGAGQLYCHRYEDAFIAFAVNLGLIWAAYDAFDNEQYGLGGLLSFVGIGFYAGNIYGAVNDAHKFNQQQIERYVDQLKQQQMHLTHLPYDNNTDGHRNRPLLSLKIPF